MDDIANGPLPIYEPQPIALKATTNKEGRTNMVAQVEAAGLNDDKMMFVIKRFKTVLKGRKEYPNKTKSKKKRSPASNVVSPVVLLHNVPIMKMTRDKKRNVRRRKKELQEGEG
jgi:hypothetical protein